MSDSIQIAELKEVLKEISRVKKKAREKSKKIRSKEEYINILFDTVEENKYCPDLQDKEMGSIQFDREDYSEKPPLRRFLQLLMIDEVLSVLNKESNFNARLEMEEDFYGWVKFIS